MSAKNILITGRPRVGKSTLIKLCAQLLGSKAGGFYTEEISGEGIRGRRGFRLVTLAGESHILAEVDAESSYRVGRYGVFLEVLDQLAAPALFQAIENRHQPWILIDEIGRMEEGSEKFKQALLAALASSKRVLASIRWHDSPFTQAIKQREDVIIYKMTVPNRESLTRQVKNELTSGNSN
jgi:nucleoside-triphosphatase THEP1